jgi:solute:Na+ symporter, SSS family
VGKPGSHFGGPLQLIPFTQTKGYIALTAFVLNVLVAVLLTLVLRAAKVPPGSDETSPSDYHADAGDPGVQEVLEGEPGTAPTTP